MAEQFGTRVYDAPQMPIDVDAYTYACELLTKKIKKESCQQAKDVYEARERILRHKKLRLIRLAMRQHIYDYAEVNTM